MAPEVGIGETASVGDGDRYQHERRRIAEEGSRLGLSTRHGK
jgi:hypothetical protein